MNGHEKGDTKIAKRRHDNLKKPCFQGVWRSENTVQVLFPAPSASTIDAASELIRNDGFAFLYAKPGQMPPLSPVFRRNTRLGLHHGPGSFVNLSDQPRRDFNSRGFFRICRVPRVRRVIRVIRVIRVRIENHVPINHKQPGVDCATVQSTPGHVL